MSKNANQLSWGQALAKFAGIMLTVYGVIFLSSLTMWIPNILAAGYLVYILVWERPAKA